LLFKIKKKGKTLNWLHKELIFQTKENVLLNYWFIANKELAFQNQEKEEKRAAEWLLPTENLWFQNQEKKTCCWIFAANRELLFFRTIEKEKGHYLIFANQELKKSRRILEYIKGLRKWCLWLHIK
jgi:hypothetical protein